MQRPPIEKLRRLTLGLALLLIVVSVATYAVRSWRARQARKSVPAVASDIKQQAERFSFTRSEAGHTLFVIQASRTIERQGRKIMLEDVSVVVYGREGNRADEIRTGRCEYDASGKGQIFCPDPVWLELSAEGIEGAKDKPSPRRLRIETARVRFDQASGIAHTPEPVTFRFDEGYGKGIGLRYQPGQPAVVLERNVEMVLNAGQTSVRLRGQSLGFNSRERRLRLRPPVEVVADEHELTARELVLAFNSAYQVERLEASGSVSARARSVGRLWDVRADQAMAEFTPGQRLARLTVAGQVEVKSQGGQEDFLRCDRAEILFSPADGAVDRVRAAGDALVRSHLPAETRTLAAEQLELQMHPDGRSAQRLTTHPRGVLSAVRASGERRQIEADQIELQFDAENHLTDLAARGGVEVVWNLPARPQWRTVSHELHARFASDGELARLEQWGDFRFREENREATAGRAEFDGERKLFRLTGTPTLSDERGRLRAARIELSQTDGRMAAYGDVRATYAASGTTRLFSSAVPVHLVADEMQGERGAAGQGGWARYAGRARLWQGENRLAADTIELRETPRELVAVGGVSSVLVERAANEPAASPRVLRITSERFRYAESERQGTYEDNVRGEGEFGRIQGQRLEMFLSKGTGSEGAHLERARASGGVVLEQDGRRAEAENADYDVPRGVLVLWGGEPQVSDARAGVARGARLTFHLADDTIRIESETGSPTVTRRTWYQ